MHTSAIASILLFRMVSAEGDLTMNLSLFLRPHQLGYKHGVSGSEVLGVLLKRYPGLDKCTVCDNVPRIP